MMPGKCRTDEGFVVRRAVISFAAVFISSFALDEMRCRNTLNSNADVLPLHCSRCILAIVLEAGVKHILHQIQPEQYEEILPNLHATSLCYRGVCSHQTWTAIGITQHAECHFGG